MNKAMVIRSSFVVLALLLAGCSDAPTTQPTSMQDRQDAALKDPFGYSVDMSKDENTGTMDLDKQGLKKDIDDVLNP